MNSEDLSPQYPRTEREGDLHSLSEVIHEVTDSLKSVVRSEFHIAKAEFKESGKYVARYSSRLIAFAAIAALGVLPFVAFLVVGLGSLLGDNYWLSSLIVSIVLFTIGGIGAYAMLKKVKLADLRFENTRTSVTEHLSTVDRKLHEVTDIAKARALRRNANEQQ